MAVGKGGAGPYSGYKKNYAPIKSSKGTKAEKVVRKVLKAANGPSTIKDPKTGKTVQVAGAGLGVVGTMARAAARTAARNAGRSTKGLTQREVKEAREWRRDINSNLREWRDGNRDMPLPTKEARRSERMDSGRGADNRPRSGAESKAYAKTKKAKDIARTSNAKWLPERTKRGRVANGSISAPRTSVPAKIKTSPKKRSK